MLCLSCSSLLAQVPSDPIEPDPLNPQRDTTVYFYIDEVPVLNSGNVDDFIKANFKCSEALKKEYTGKYIFVAFVIEKEGVLSNVRILQGKGLNPKLDAEALRVVNLTNGNWRAGKVNGSAVRCMYKIKVTI